MLSLWSFGYGLPFADAAPAGQLAATVESVATKAIASRRAPLMKGTLPAGLAVSRAPQLRVSARRTVHRVPDGVAYAVGHRDEHPDEDVARR